MKYFHRHLQFGVRMYLKGSCRVFMRGLHFVLLKITNMAEMRHVKIYLIKYKEPDSPCGNYDYIRRTELHNSFL